jgi:carbonic anhydrase
MLASEGYDLTNASGGEEALALIADTDAPRRVSPWRDGESVCHISRRISSCKANDIHHTDPMRLLSQLFTNNKAWASEMTRENPEFFSSLSAQQAPLHLWIGCSDSRVPANEIVGLAPGEMFVHRNVANVVVHADLNCLSAVQYAVDALRVQHIIVCGHYGCGGVLAALRDDRLGLVDNWLRHVQDVRWKHQAQLDALGTETERHRRLCELNVIEQVVNVSQTTIVRDAWARGQSLAVHGWIYDIHDGLLRDLGICVTSVAELSMCDEAARRTEARVQRD